jgi:transposase
MKAYSEDLRRKVVEAVEQRGMGKSDAARSFGVSLSSVKRYVGKARQGNSLSPKKHPGPRPKIDEKARRLLEADVEERPALPLRERGRFLERVAGVSVSESTLSRLLRRMGFSPKEGRWVRPRGTSS